MAPRYNSPPNWPPPPAGWSPPPGWSPDPSWGPAPQGWPFWVDDSESGSPDHRGVLPAADVGEESAGAEKSRSWFARHKLLTGAGVLVLLVVAIAALVGGNDDAGQEPVAATTTEAADSDEKSAEEIAAEEQAEADRLAEEEAAAAAAAEEERLAEEQRLAEEAAAAEAAAAEAARIGSVAQQNAYRSAVSYLEYTGFSRSGLIGQLEFEGYSTADAEFAIARLEAEGGVDWNAEAAESAASYLDYTAFSRAGLVDQLLYEGFTPEQAEYGVSTTGL